MNQSEMTCNAGYTAIALVEGYVQVVEVAGMLVKLSRSGEPHTGTPFEIVVIKNGNREYARSHHWIADARQTFNRQVRYHLGEHLKDMARDMRFTVSREFTGQAYKVWVCRFCGEFYSTGITKSQALMIAWEKKYGDSR